MLFVNEASSTHELNIRSIGSVYYLEIVQLKIENIQINPDDILVHFGIFKLTGNLLHSFEPQSLIFHQILTTPLATFLIHSPSLLHFQLLSDNYEIGIFVELQGILFVFYCTVSIRKLMLCYSTFYLNDTRRVFYLSRALYLKY